MGFFDGILGGALSLIGGERANDKSADIASANNALNAELAGENRNWSAEQASINRDFQQRMSDTSYQRATTDLLKAGLNPMLSLMKGGASTPSGATATSATATASGNPTMRDTITPALTTALQTRQADAQVKLLEAQAFRERAEGWAAVGKPDNIEADTNLKRVQAGLGEQTARKTDQEVNNLREQQQVIKSLVDKIKVETEHEGVKIAATQAAADLANAHELYTRGQISIQRYESRIKEATSKILQYALPGAKNVAEAQSTISGDIGAHVRALGIGDISGILRDILTGRGALGR